MSTPDLMAMLTKGANGTPAPAPTPAIVSTPAPAPAPTPSVAPSANLAAMLASVAPAPAPQTGATATPRDVINAPEAHRAVATAAAPAPVRTAPTMDPAYGTPDAARFYRALALAAKAFAEAMLG